jgi:hypothetical protein
MIALVSVETLLLVLLLVLVAGLLRSHAELLRRLGPAGDGPDPTAAPSRERAEVAPELSGITPSGDALKLAFDSGGSATLLAFLTSGCSTCARFWGSLGERRLPSGVQTVIVTRGSDREQPAKLRSLAPGGVPVVMSSEAWEAFAVPGAPYFVLVEDGRVRGEGVSATWEAMSSLVSDAIEERREVRGGPLIDETLAAAGIGPDDPSLYPAGRRQSTS